ncbi:hypothetical protein FKW77_003993 [Venturia effusa]|uniref:Integral membrane protein n=1 Tax=Venturia effusa TaxID=50376 RepID=A0A517LH51_9PEZI|nr:hypothetical protein FKW77_003993 [Venturia effusa]
MTSILRSLTPINPAPRDYVVPAFPSLYWPFPLRSGQANYLYHATDIWRFTVLWTLLFYGAVHLSVAVYAMIIGRKNWKVIWIVPIVYVVIGGTEAIIAGSIVGGL